MGEFELLAKLRERLPPGGARVMLGSGDDAAVTVPGGATATSVDAIVEGIHFRAGEAPPALVGRKALATALSDLAAMGAEAGEAYVVLGAPTDLGEDELLGVLDGLLEVAAETGTTLAGGDLTRAPALTLAVTVVGHAASPEKLVGRDGADPGDLLVLTGEIGAAAAGRLLLDDPGLAGAVSAETAERLRARQLDPTPRLRSGRALAAAGARAMIDLSDGLAGDAGHLASSSGVAIAIEAGALPLAKGVAEVAAAAGRDPLELAASGGEDYELLAALPVEALEEASSRIGEAAEATLTPVGKAMAGRGVQIRLPAGGLLEPQGFDHLAGPQFRPR
ncbi:MAG TPA: thiamine-phosphate kinase [Solirubrobacterales bacterium]|jgi:thiamine-monophosphate kinase|nr:thiamine-phosphate kinase [Solirubrobacterales bacterium]